MYKKLLLCLIFLFLSISMISSVPLIPSGNIVGMGIRSIHNFTNISADKFCDDLDDCITIPQIKAINTSDNINNLFSNTTFYAQEINGSINSSNIKNTPTACSVTNTFMTEYAGSSSTCTSTDFSVINNTAWNFTDVKITESLNLTNKTISNVYNLTFQNGGGIWDNGTHICIGSC